MSAHSSKRTAKMPGAVAAVYMPKDFQLNDIMTDIVKLVDGEKRAA